MCHYLIKHAYIYIYIYIYIVNHRLTVSLYHNSSVWLDTYLYMYVGFKECIFRWHVIIQASFVKDDET